MGRRGYGSIFTALAREAERQRRIEIADQKRRVKETEKAKREAARQAILNAKEAKQIYLQSRIDEVDEMNAEIREKIDEFSQVLIDTLSTNSTISFDSLKIHEEGPKYNPPKEFTTPNKEPLLEYFMESIKKARID